MKESFRAFIVEKWVPALRSGDYVQGVDRLKENGKYCCLGVACDLAGGEWDYVGSFHQADKFVYKGEWAMTSLPCQLAEEFGICVSGDIYVIQGEEDIFQFASGGDAVCVNLIDANDLARWSFDKIADLLENMASDTPSYEFRSWSDQW